MADYQPTQAELESREYQKDYVVAYDAAVNRNAFMLDAGNARQKQLYSQFRAFHDSLTTSQPSSPKYNPNANFSSVTGEQLYVNPKGQIINSPSSPSYTGGFSSVTGQSQIVTPSGQVVGSAMPIQPNTSTITYHTSYEKLNNQSIYQNVKAFITKDIPEGQRELDRQAKVFVSPVTNWLQEKGITKKSVSEFAGNFATAPFNKNPSPLKSGVSGLTEGLITTAESPSQVLNIAATGYLAGAGSRVAAYGLKSAGGAVAGVKGALYTEKTINYGLAGTASILISKDVYKIETTPSENKYSEYGKLISESAIFGYGFSKGMKGGEKIIGGLRTFGTKRLPAEYEAKIFDPKERAGEVSFPEINKGESAGQLKKRFYEPKLPGEEPGIPRGFTASDIPFPKKEIIPEGKIVKGTLKSELPGRYMADVVSPHFLRTGGESSSPAIVSLTSFGGEPTITRSTVAGIDFAPGITSRTKRTGRSKYLKEYFGGARGMGIDEIRQMNPIAKKGYASIPFIKTEREAIITKGSTFTTTGKRYYIELDGVKIPIIEKKSADIFEKSAIKVKTKRLINIDEAASSSTSPVRRSYYNPASITGYYLIRKSSISSSGRSSISSSIIGYSKSNGGERSKPSGSNRGGSSWGGGSSTGSGGGSSLRPPIGGSYTGRGGSSYGIPAFPRRTYNPPRSPKLKFKIINPKTRQTIFKQPTKYTPSLTGSILNLKGRGLKLGGGYAPFGRGIGGITGKLTKRNRRKR